MKISMPNRLLYYTFILLMIFIACYKDHQSVFSSSSPIKSGDSELFKKSYKNISIKDEANENKLELRISCTDTGLLNEYVKNEWQLITMHKKDLGLNAAFSEDDPFVFQNYPISCRMRIEIVNKVMKEDVVGFYIQRKNNSVQSINQNKHFLIESVFISEFESLGGYIQIIEPDLMIGNSIWIKVETLDDPSVESKTGNIELSKQNRFLSIGFSDQKEMSHAWSVLVRHDISTFPIVYWIGENKLP